MNTEVTKLCIMHKLPTPGKKHRSCQLLHRNCTYSCSIHIWHYTSTVRCIMSIEMWSWSQLQSLGRCINLAISQWCRSNGRCLLQVLASQLTATPTWRSRCLSHNSMSLQPIHAYIEQNPHGLGIFCYFQTLWYGSSTKHGIVIMCCDYILSMNFSFK